MFSVLALIFAGIFRTQSVWI